MLLVKAASLHPISRLDDREAVALQGRPHQRTHDRIVVDDKNDAVTSSPVSCIGSSNDVGDDWMVWREPNGQRRRAQIIDGFDEFSAKRDGRRLGRALFALTNALRSTVAAATSP
jgi:hypothetical protein